MTARRSHPPMMLEPPQRRTRHSAARCAALLRPIAAAALTGSLLVVTFSVAHAQSDETETDDTPDRTDRNRRHPDRTDRNRRHSDRRARGADHRRCAGRGRGPGLGALRVPAAPAEPLPPRGAELERLVPRPRLLDRGGHLRLGALARRSDGPVQRRIRTGRPALVGGHLRCRGVPAGQLRRGGRRSRNRWDPPGRHSRDDRTGRRDVPDHRRGRSPGDDRSRRGHLRHHRHARAPKSRSAPRARPPAAGQPRRVNPRRSPRSPASPAARRGPGAPGSGTP